MADLGLFATKAVVDNPLNCSEPYGHLGLDGCLSASRLAKCYIQIPLDAEGTENNYEKNDDCGIGGIYITAGVQLLL